MIDINENRKNLLKMLANASVMSEQVFSMTNEKETILNQARKTPPIKAKTLFFKEEDGPVITSHVAVIKNFAALDENILFYRFGIVVKAHPDFIEVVFEFEDNHNSMKSGFPIYRSTKNYTFVVNTALNVALENRIPCSQKTFEFSQDIQRIAISYVFTKQNMSDCRKVVNLFMDFLKTERAKIHFLYSYLFEKMLLTHKAHELHKGTNKTDFTRYLLIDIQHIFTDILYGRYTVNFHDMLEIMGCQKGVRFIPTNKEPVLEELDIIQDVAGEYDDQIKEQLMFLTIIQKLMGSTDIAELQHKIRNFNP